MNKLIKLLIPFGICILSTSAQAETVGEALTKCGQVQNSLERLVCYDNIVEKMSRYGGMQELMQVPAPLPAENNTPLSNSKSNSADVQRNSEFGKQPKLPENTDDKIYASVVDVTKDGLKRAIFTLDNGHQWREQEPTNFKVKVKDVIYIERGALGSYHLSKDSLNRRIRVKRIN